MDKFATFIIDFCISKPTTPTQRPKEDFVPQHQRILLFATPCHLVRSLLTSSLQWCLELPAVIIISYIYIHVAMICTRHEKWVFIDSFKRSFLFVIKR